MKNFFEKMSFAKVAVLLVILTAVVLGACIAESNTSDDVASSLESAVNSVAQSIDSASSEAISEDSTQSSAESSEIPSEQPSTDASEQPSEDSSEESSKDATSGVGDENAVAKLENIPEYSGKDYIEINGNVPHFTASQLTTVGYETYGELDSLGRCTFAVASVGKDTFPTGDRGSISGIKPTGWIQAKYDFIKTKDLYNRSHLIAWALAGEDANKQNLVTGTAHLNQDVMTKFEDMILDYIRETGNHVAYRVTPLFKGNELVCRGIQMEAYSVDDNGEGICFNVYCYNVQEGVIIDYATGESKAENAGDTSEDTSKEESSVGGGDADYILNTSSKKIHLPDCGSVSTMSDKNKAEYHGSIEDLLNQGYKPCGTCKPQ